MPTWPPRACTAGRAATGSCCRSCCSPRRYRLRAINRWKMLDNLRRSLVAPMSLALLLLALAGAVVSPWAALALVLAAFSAGPLMGAVAGFAPSRDDIAKRHFYRQAAIDLARALCGGLWLLAQLLQQALMAVDAIVRALYRMTVSRRHLLQWTTAASRAGPGEDRACRRCCASTGACRWWRCCCSARCSPRPRRTRRWRSRCACCGRASPLWTWWVSRPRPARDGRGAAAARPGLPGRHRARHLALLRALRRRRRTTTCRPTTCRSRRYDMVAHRTSPTNIGLYLLSVACARRVRLDRHAGAAGAARGHAGHAGHAAAPPRPLPELVRHADAARRCCRCTCPPSTAATSAATCWRWPRPAWSWRGAARPAARRPAASRQRLRRCSAWPDCCAARRRTARLLPAGPLAVPARPAHSAPAADRRWPAAPSGLGTGSTSWPGCRRSLRRCAPGDSGGACSAAAPAGACEQLAWRPTSLPVPPQAAPVPHRLPRRRAAARRRLLRPAGVGVAPDQPAGHRQGRRAGAPLGRARPAVLRRRRATPGCARGRARCSST